jgi:hypothetical protein
MNRPASALLLALLVVSVGGTETRSAQAAPRPVGWYEFRPANDLGPSAIGMEGWNDAPAGALGRIARDGDRLLYGGRPIRLWGLNLTFAATAPEPRLADRRAAFYSKYGVNSVRLHKFADGPGWAGIQSAESCVSFDPEALDRMDYQVSRLKEAGIFLTLSAHFGTLRLGPGDRDAVPFLDEFGSFEGDRNRIATPHSAIHYSPELQDLHIRQMVNLLEHENPYTGMTYAEDPAIAFVEVINEQSILFYTSTAPLKQSPTLRRQAAERFSDWLRREYGNHEGLVRAWGRRALDSFADQGFPAVGEHLDRRNILPIGTPYFWASEQLDGSQRFRRQRLLDTARFLYGLQNEFYARYVAALREAGYEGEVLGSNWQAGHGVSHLYNLHSDALVGAIDRHNYFGGARGRDESTFNNASMLRRAGSAMLSSGLQQVFDRPFMLSEWIHVWPNEWGVEGPAIIGAYGMGLQGWDVSYLFQNADDGEFSDRLGASPWDVTAPQILGMFPAIARQVRRGDVAESTVQATLNAHVPALAEGSVGFTDKMTQDADLKGFDSDEVPARALAVARASVRFADSDRDTPEFDLSPYEQDGTLVSSTGQLRWTEGTSDDPHSGFFTMDTPGTKAVVGFAEGQAVTLGSVSITPRCRFGAIYLTAPGPVDSIDSADRLILVAMARARNTGMTLGPNGDELLEAGTGPILLEPVAAEVRLEGRPVAEVRLLDHDGRRTDRTLKVRDGGFTIDGARDRTPYYEVIFE